MSLVFPLRRPRILVCKWTLLIATVGLMLIIPGGAEAERTRIERYLIGAHYYVWFPAHFINQGFVRDKLIPAQKPYLGLYDSQETAVIEQHIAWCSRFGIDFLTLDWWPSRSEHNANVSQAFLSASNLGDIKFCIFYETGDLGYSDETGAITFTASVAATFIADVLNVAETFFDNPSYLKIAGRPVILFYLTRTLYGDYAQAFNRLRQELHDRGHDAFFIGDEIFWQVSVASKESTSASRGEDKSTQVSYTSEPQTARMRLFDAITSYNMYSHKHLTHAGYGQTSSYVAAVKAIYDQYLTACGDEVDFAPQIIPGYNDRGARPNEDHFAIPRQWAPGGEEGSFLAENFDRIAFPYIDPDLNLIFITSFNEWSEDSAIEPLAYLPATTTDESASGVFYTQGYSYSGFGTKYLEVIRSKVAAVSGRVTDEFGAGRPGITVTASQDSILLAHDSTDQAGYYTLSRLHLGPGVYEVCIANQTDCRQVIVTSYQTADGVDFTY